jgi:hypothetical protein
MGRHPVTEEGFSPRSHLCPLLTDSHSPHACPTPGVYTFTVTKTVLRLLTSLALGFSNRPDRKSQSSVAATGPLPGVLTSSTHSLTWRESLTGLATCSFQPQPPPSPGESVTHRSDNLFPSTWVPTQSGNYEAQHEHTLASKPPTVKHCVTTTVHGKHRHGLSQTGDRQTLQHNKARKIRDASVFSTSNTG